MTYKNLKANSIFGLLFCSKLCKIRNHITNQMEGFFMDNDNKSLITILSKVPDYRLCWP
jgi:hypothetical protein